MCWIKSKKELTFVGQSYFLNQGRKIYLNQWSNLFPPTEWWFSNFQNSFFKKLTKLCKDFGGISKTKKWMYIEYLDTWLERLNMLEVLGLERPREFQYCNASKIVWRLVQNPTLISCCQSSFTKILSIRGFPQSKYGGKETIIFMDESHSCQTSFRKMFVMEGGQWWIN